MKIDWYTQTFLFILFLSLGAIAEDLPSEKLEMDFHKIYRQYNQQPTDREIWDQAITQQTSKVYQVQDKDTLWDVSKTLFADSNFWPKIWAQNTISIDNPHEIDPNMEIEFYPGTFDDAPSVAFVNIQSKEDKNKREKIKVLIPPSMTKPKKIIKNLPDSLPVYRYAQKLKTKKEWKISARHWGSERVQQYLTQFVSEKLPESIGKVISTELGTVGAYQFQYVFIQLTQTDVKKVKIMQVVDRIKSSSKDQSTKSGQVIQILGELEVIEELSGRPGVYKALVTQQINPIQVGASVYSGELQSFTVQTASSSIQSIGAEIVGGPLAQKTRLGQVEDYIYLGAGTVEGFAVGQVLNLYSRAKSYALIGQVQIVHVAAGFSTAIILQQNDVIEIGDYAGGEKGGRPLVMTPIEHSRVEQQNKSEVENEEDEITTDEFNFNEVPENSTVDVTPSEDQNLEQVELNEPIDGQSSQKNKKSNNEYLESELNQNEDLESELNQNEELEFEEDSTGEELSRQNENPEEVPNEVDMSGDQR